MEEPRMSQYAQQAAAAGDKFLAALASTQDDVIKYLAARPATAPANPATAAAVKTTQALADAGFGFALKLVAQQQAFFAKLYALQQQGTRSGSARASAQSATPKATASAKRKTAKRRPAKKTGSRGATAPAQ